MSIKNLSEVSEAEQLEFIDSFDQILTDIDGVLWLLWVPIPEASECLDNFRKLGKKIAFVTNYAGAPLKVMHQRLIKSQFKCDIDDIINPYRATVAYLKKNNFQKKIYAISTQQYKEHLRKEGFNVAEDPAQMIEETAEAILKNIGDDEEIGAVLYDYDINITFLKLQKALTYLKRKDCLFLVAAADRILPVGPAGPLLGNEFFYAALQKISGRQAIQIAKPSTHFNEFVKETFNISDPKRTLFIGDVIKEDMGFATVGGYQKLLVLSGTTQIEDIKDWKHPEEYKPNYYIQNLTELNKIIKKVHKL